MNWRLVRFLLCASFLCAPLADGEDEILYQGKTVRQWAQQLSTSTESDAQREAAQAIGFAGTAGKDALPALIEALHQKRWGAREEVLYAIGMIGQDAVPQLVAALHHDDDHDLGEALGRCGPASVPALIEELRRFREPGGSPNHLSSTVPDSSYHADYRLMFCRT